LEGLVELPHLGVLDPEILQSVGVAGGPLRDLAPLGDCLIVPTQATQRDGKIVTYGRILGLEVHRLRRVPWLRLVAMFCGDT